jgi:hypothetical protein
VAAGACFGAELEARRALEGRADFAGDVEGFGGVDERVVIGSFLKRVPQDFFPRYRLVRDWFLED